MCSETEQLLRKLARKDKAAMIPVYLSPFANHLWQSTLFAAVAILLTLALTEEPRAGALLGLAGCLDQVSHPLFPAGQRWQPGGMAERTFGSAYRSRWRWNRSASRLRRTSGPRRLPPPRHRHAFPIALMLVAVWFCGCAAVLSVWWVRWLRIRGRSEWRRLCAWKPRSR